MKKYEVIGIVTNCAGSKSSHTLHIEAYDIYEAISSFKENFEMCEVEVISVRKEKR